MSQCPAPVVRIRPFEAGDREAVLALAPRLVVGIAPWRDPVGMLAAARRWIEGSIAAIGTDRAVLVAEDGPATRLGFVSVGRDVNVTGEVQAYVGELVVAADAEGTGVGRALLGAVEGWAREHDLGLVVLDTGAANTRARRFYARLGYVEEGVKLAKVLPTAGR